MSFIKATFCYSSSSKRNRRKSECQEQIFAVLAPKHNNRMRQNGPDLVALLLIETPGPATVYQQLRNLLIGA